MYEGTKLIAQELKGRCANITLTGLLFTVMFIVLGGNSAKGQRVYATTSSQGGTPIIGSVTAAGNAIDASDTTNYSTITSLLGALGLVGDYWQNISFPSSPAQNSPVTIKFGNPGTIASVVNGVFIQKTNSGTPVGTEFSGAGITGLLIGGSQVAELTINEQGFPYNGVRVKVSSAVLGLGLSARLYYAYFITSPTIDPATICNGNSATLLVKNPYTGYRYNWYDSNGQIQTGTSTSLTVSPTSTTTYYVEAVEPGSPVNHYSAKIPVTVTVNPLPTVAAITGNSNVCTGQTTTFSNATAGGVWTTNDAAKATINSSGVVTGVAPGSATITYTVTSVNNCSTAVTKTITVDALPIVPVITGGSTVCTGQTTAFSNTTGGGVWTTSDATKASVNSSGVVTGIAAGSATITYTVTNANNCVTAVTKIITINASPSAPNNITGTPTVCVGQTTTLATTTTGGAWTSSDPLIATVNGSGVVTGIVGGTATISYTVTNGTCTASATRVVTVNTLPVIPAITGNNDVCTSQTITLSNATSGGNWSSSDPTKATISGSGVVTGILTGSTTITYTVTNGAGCTTSVTKSIIIHTTPAAPHIITQ